MEILGTEKEKEFRVLVAITRIHHSIGATLDLEEITRILAREIKGIVNCDGCAIMLIENNNLKILASLGFSRASGYGQLTTDTPVVRYILATKQGIVTGDIRDTFFAGSIPAGKMINSLVCMPIIINGVVRGIIHLDSARKNAFRDEDMEFIRLLGNEVSIAFERSFLYSQIKDISIQDGLTGCLNRRKFDVDIVAEIAAAKQSGKPLSMLMIDIDWFKKYNDFHGHQKGDVILQKLAQVIKAGVRPYDKSYRYGGEEFAVILPETAKDKAAVVAERLRKTIQQETFERADKSQPDGRLTISIGVAGFPADAGNVTELIRAADTAMYSAKNSGRNRVTVFEGEKQL